MDLATIGWNAALEEEFAPFAEQGLIPARVARTHSATYQIYAKEGELTAELTGRMKHEATSRSELPAVGDWVAVQPNLEEGKGMVQAVLPRKSCFSRKEASVRTEEQVVAANVDTVFLVAGLDRDFNLRRLERYLVLALDSGASPVVVLNKADLCDELEVRVAEVEGIAFGVPVHPISATEKEGLEPLFQYLGQGQTVALLGSSGVGKSTLINSLLGREVLAVGAVRADDQRGRHTTTHRELVPMPGGGVLIDNPGMRELQLWTDEEGLKETFEDVEALAGECRFRDCGHSGEPGCAVQRGLSDGTLDPKRFESYLKLQRELQHLAARQDYKERMAVKERGKQIAKWSKQFNKERSEGKR